ncbi:Nucleosome assembly protein [Hanseniaspora osmophila]|uniref:Nucleosome assembly protein n=1 Tax=Hanseniaspora osmophila TaxID=56408 RepID=A0A1E5R5A9_9ASCO|nr:Nucleosome assembly protein [Hanseniaspora osmophila]
MAGNKPIPNRNQKDFKIANAPTPHNTPSGDSTSFLNKSTSPTVGNGIGERSGKKEDKSVTNDSTTDSTNNSSATSAATTTTTTTKKTTTATDSPSTTTTATTKPSPLGLMQNEVLLQSIQDKLGDLVGQDSGYVNALGPQVKNRIYALKHLQAKLNEAEWEFQQQLYELERSFVEKHYKPIFEQRANLINGVVKPTKEEVANGKAIEKELAEEDDTDEDAEEDAEEETEETEDNTGVPAFWLTAFDNLPTVSQTITDRDAEVLEYLENVELQYLAHKDSSPLGFNLIFSFNSEENPYFTDNTLVKTYYYQNELGYSGDFVYDHADGCEIHWKGNDFNVTIEVETKKQRNKATKQIREIKKIIPVESFFNFFDPPKIPATEENDEKDDNDKEHEEDEDEELESRLALDYALGEEFKDKLIPRAIDWFTGVALDFEMDGMPQDEDEYDEEDEDEFDDNEDFDGEGEDDEQEEDEENDDFANTKKEQPPECKQS